MVAPTAERTIDNFDAFSTLVQHFHEMTRAHDAKMRRAKDAEQAVIHRRAAKVFDKAWSGHEMAVVPSWQPLFNYSQTRAKPARQRKTPEAVTSGPPWWQARLDATGAIAYLPTRASWASTWGSTRALR